MCDLRPAKRASAGIAIWTVLSMLTACSGGDDFAITCGGHSCIDTSSSSSGDNGIRYAMYQCEIYYLAGSGWQECGFNGTPGSSIRVGGFIDINACYDMIGVLEVVDPYIFDRALEDQWRGYAMLLWCE